ncbi:hypothetical protein GCM10029964_047240 [Kibdelosporangium lantanae]
MTEIKPFHIAIPQFDLDDLRRRLADVRWPDEPAGIGSSRGVPLADMRALVDHWRDTFDWRAQEDRLNAYPQFVTEIDGQAFHFVHVRSDAPDPLPVLLVHGWPSSFVEFLSLVEPMTAAGYDVVIPSLPGFGFSTPVADTGWGNLFQVAAAFAGLMTRLGYERFAAHGGDVGAGVAAMLPMVAPGRVVATHVSGPGAFPFGPPIDPEGLNDVDAARAKRFNEIQQDGLGYLHLQATRPATLAYSLTDSPVGQLAWIAEKYREWTDVAVSVDQLLTIVSLYWFTRSGPRRPTSRTRGCRRSASSPARATVGHCPPVRRRPSRCSGTTRRSGRSSTRPVRPCDGRSSTVAGTSRRWRCRSCWPVIWWVFLRRTGLDKGTAPSARFRTERSITGRVLPWNWACTG